MLSCWRFFRHRFLRNPSTKRCVSGSSLPGNRRTSEFSPIGILVLSLIILKLLKLFPKPAENHTKFIHQQNSVMQKWNQPRYRNKNIYKPISGIIGNVSENRKNFGLKNHFRNHWKCFGNSSPTETKNTKMEPTQKS